jgi:hypothetical protein
MVASRTSRRENTPGGAPPEGGYDPDPVRRVTLSAKPRISVAFAGKDWDGVAPDDYPLKPILESRYEVGLSERPDFVFVKESTKLYRSLFDRYGKAPVRIFFAGEAIVPDFNLFDYGIAFDPIAFGDRYFQIHPLVFFERHLAYGSLDRTGDPAALLATKDRFCDFIYSNAKAHPDRDRLFEMLGAYRRVDSAGGHLNNHGDEIVRAADWRAAKVAFQRRSRFSVAFENALHRGYTTEKLINPMVAGSIPIYWGNPDVGLWFNTRAFVNCHEHRSLEEVVERVRAIDRDDELWLAMAREPWMTPEQRERHARNREEFVRFLHSFLDRSPADARRRGQGYWNDKYEENVRDRAALEASALGRLHRALGKLRRG